MPAMRQSDCAASFVSVKVAAAFTYGTRADYWSQVIYTEKIGSLGFFHKRKTLAERPPHPLQPYRKSTNCKPL
jgi:hypothetical protein